ncbi:MAG: hypothetical protein ACYTGX_02850 [Planctomycetota bacterium]|jgi:WD40 repeat protein
MRTTTLLPASLLSLVAVIAGCGTETPPAAPGPFEGTPTDIQLTAAAAGFEARLIKGGLNNPSSVAFSPDGKQVAVCDSGNGQVLIGTLAGQSAYATLSGFDTEHWKVKKDEQGKVVSESFKLGPLSAVWVGGEFAVTDAGKPDGAETIRFYPEAKGSASLGTATNAVAPTTKEAADKGEGNLTGMAVAGDNDTIYVCGQGFDGKSWVLKAQRSTRKLEPLLSADDHGIGVNSPMQCLVWDDDHLLVLYSGKGGAQDGTIVKWQLSTQKPVAQWTLDGLVDPMGMARIPHTDDLAVVDNNWALTKVNAGSLARVTLHDGGKADVTPLATGLRGPVSCAFGPDGRLWITQLGPEFDKGLGELLAVSGFVSTK